MALMCVDGQWTLENAGGRNAIFLNGSVMKRSAELSHHDRIEFGRYIIRFLEQTEGEEDEPAAEGQGASEALLHHGETEAEAARLEEDEETELGLDADMTNDSRSYPEISEKVKKEENDGGLNSFTSDEAWLSDDACVECCTVGCHGDFAHPQNPRDGCPWHLKNELSTNSHVCGGGVFGDHVHDMHCKEFAAKNKHITAADGVALAGCSGTRSPHAKSPLTFHLRKPPGNSFPKLSRRTSR